MKMRTKPRSINYDKFSRELVILVALSLVASLIFTLYTLATPPFYISKFAIFNQNESTNVSKKLHDNYVNALVTNNFYGKDANNVCGLGALKSNCTVLPPTAIYSLSLSKVAHNFVPKLFSMKIAIAVFFALSTLIITLYRNRYSIVFIMPFWLLFAPLFAISLDYWYLPLLIVIPGIFALLVNLYPLIGGAILGLGMLIHPILFILVFAASSKNVTKVFIGATLVFVAGIASSIYQFGFGPWEDYLNILLSTITSHMERRDSWSFLSLITKDLVINTHLTLGMARIIVAGAILVLFALVGVNIVQKTENLKDSKFNYKFCLISESQKLENSALAVSILTMIAIYISPSFSFIHTSIFIVPLTVICLHSGIPNILRLSCPAIILLIQFFSINMINPTVAQLIFHLLVLLVIVGSVEKGRAKG